MNNSHTNGRDSQFNVLHGPFEPSSVTGPESLGYELCSVPEIDRAGLRPSYTRVPEIPYPNYRNTVDIPLSEVKNVADEEVDFKMKKKIKKTDNTSAGIYGNMMSEGKGDDYPRDDEEDAESLAEWESNGDDGDDYEPNCLARAIIAIQKWCKAGYGWLSKKTKGYFIPVIFLIAYFVYFVAAMCHEFNSEASTRLMWCTILGVVILFKGVIRRAIKAIIWKCYGNKEIKPSHEKRMNKARFFLRWICYGALAAVMVYTFIKEGVDDPKNLRALPGLIIFLLIPTLMSDCPGKINWHTVFWGVGLQFLLAFSVLKWSVGRDCIVWAQDRFNEFFANADAGSVFLFGDNYRDHYVIFGAIPIMFYANAALTVLYYFGVMKFLIRVIGSVLNFVLGTSPVESTCVASGVFLEGAITIMMLKPYLPTLTKSEMFSVIVSIYSTLGGAYLAILNAIGISLEYLIPAMIISAPATFVIAKLMVPETKKVVNTAEEIKKIDSSERGRYVNAMDAAQTGALTMLQVVGSVCVVIFAFYSFIYWFNHTLAWFGDRVGKDNLSIEYISSYLMYPCALFMGVQPDDCRQVAYLLGYRMWIHNVLAFYQLGALKRNGMRYAAYMVATNYTGPVSEDSDSMDMTLTLWNETLPYGVISQRSEAILTYSMSGFSSLLNVAVITGILVSLVPKRKNWIASVAMRGLIAGNIANCMTGCFAALFYSGD